MANIVVFGSGVQGTLFGVRLQAAGHHVTLVARDNRAEQLLRLGAIVEDGLSGQRTTARLPVLQSIAPSLRADFCLITVRREQLDEAVSALATTPNVTRIVIMVNHAGGSQEMRNALGANRTVLAFPGAAGFLDAGVVHAVEVSEQPTAVETDAQDVIALFKTAGFRVSAVGDMDAWLRRHAVFVTAIGGALWQAGTDSLHLSADERLMRDFVLAVREGWKALDRHRIGPAPLALRAILKWVPLPIAVWYWRRLLASPRGELYFGAHTRHAPEEMVALASDLVPLLEGMPAPHLSKFHTVLEEAAARPDH